MHLFQADKSSQPGSDVQTCQVERTQSFLSDDSEEKTLKSSDTPRTGPSSSTARSCKLAREDKLAGRWKKMALEHSNCSDAMAAPIQEARHDSVSSSRNPATPLASRPDRSLETSCKFFRDVQQLPAYRLECSRVRLVRCRGKCMIPNMPSISTNFCRLGSNSKGLRAVLLARGHTSSQVVTDGSCERSSTADVQ